MSRPANLVVLCVDGSQESLRAARVALTLVDRQRYRFALATAIDVDTAYLTGIDPLVPMTPNVELLDVVAQRQDQAGELLSRAAEQLGLIEPETVLLSGPAGPALRTYAREEHPALIVVGARGLYDSARAGVGSVPDYLLRRAPCPVLVVRAEAVVDNTGPVLVCVDGSAHARHAAEAVTPVLPNDVPLQLVTVAAAAPAASPDETGYAMMTDRRWEDEEYSVLRDVATAIDRVDATGSVLTGPPGETLIATAEQVSARAIVIGSKGHGALARAVLGSVAHQILDNVTCPVFVAGPHS